MGTANYCPEGREFVTPALEGGITSPITSLFLGKCSNESYMLDLITWSFQIRCEKLGNRFSTSPLSVYLILFCSIFVTELNFQIWTLLLFRVFVAFHIEMNCCSKIISFNSAAVCSLLYSSICFLKVDFLAYYHVISLINITTQCY